jgi:hypothetical protein
VTVGERVMRRLVERVEIDDDSRDDLLHDANRLGRERGRCGTAGEIAALASTGLELRARHATDGDTAAFFRQGLWFGGALTAIAGVAALSPAAFAAYASPAPVVALGAIVVALVAIITRRRGSVAVVRVAACAAAVVAWWAVNLDEVGAPEAALVATSAIALVLGARPSLDRGGAPTFVVVLVATALAVGGLAAATDIGVSDVTVVFITIVVPVGLLIVSPADPRLGVAAAVALFWRFVATDPAGLAAILVALRAGESTLGPVIRWIVMAAAFLLAVSLTRRNLRLIAAR